MANNGINIQKYAMSFGTYMGLFWIAKFSLFPLGLTNPFLLLLFLGLTLVVPFMGCYYARMFRDKVCGGEIRFIRAWIFMIFMYMFAALLTAMLTISPFEIFRSIFFSTCRVSKLLVIPFNCIILSLVFLQPFIDSMKHISVMLLRFVVMP
ncbi:hypothetical protein EZS27_038897, partial [termite gut metagenome]